MHQTILVPIDIAHFAEGKGTVDIAQKSVNKDGKVILLNVIEDMPKWAAVQLPEGTLEKSQRLARGKLDSIAASYDVSVEVEIRMGIPIKPFWMWRMKKMQI